MNNGAEITLPQSTGAEKGLLGSILLSAGRVLDECVQQQVGEKYFHHPAHARIFTVLVDMREANKPIDLISLTQLLDDRRLLDGVGGASAVTDLFTFVPSASNASYYIQILREKALARRVIEASAQLAAAANNPGEHAKLSDKVRDVFSSISLSEPSEEAQAPRPLKDFGDTAPDDSKTLLGDRYLCIEGGMLFVGPSGIGKTSAGVQQDLLWSIGMPAFGIVPARPLKILTIQAEDDDGDLSEIVSGVKAESQFTREQCQQSRELCFYVAEKSHTGPEFLAKVVRPLLKKHRPDLLRINPLQAYLGGDIKDPTVTANFLRTGLNPLLAEFQCGNITTHHTPKVTFRDTTEWKASDWMYAGAGAADITNWCCAALIIDPTTNPRPSIHRRQARVKNRMD